MIWPSEKISTPNSWDSAQQCRECHQQVYEQWLGSHHQISFLNPQVRMLSDNFANKECRACHLPRPVSVTGFAMRTLDRKTRPDEGVGCLACHLAADGSIMAAQDRPEAPCQPQRNESFLSVALCESCHNQHQTTDQWRASKYPSEAITCNDCHMGSEHNHRFAGAHDLEMLRKAGEFTSRQEDKELVLSLHNVGAGHNFPTEERHRAVDMVYRFRMPDGTSSPWQLAYRFRQPYRDEEGEDTQLPAGDTVAVRIPIPIGAVKAETRLWYRLNPFAKDQDDASSLLFEQEVLL